MMRLMVKLLAFGSLWLGMVIEGCTIIARAEPAKATVGAQEKKVEKKELYQDQARLLSLEVVRPDTRLKWHNALMFGIPSVSRTVSLESHLPRRINNTMTYYINLERLQWAVSDWNKVLEKYPYAKNSEKFPIKTVRGDWLLNEVSDPRDSEALYLLLYGEKNIPKTDDDFLKFWRVDVAQQRFPYGWIETDSQVNRQKTRYVERFVTADGYSAWRTKDAFFVKNGTDPLEALSGDFKHDGRELIIQIPKVSGNAAGKLERGAAQVYLLSNGEGKIAQEAPVRLVQDHNQTLGQAAIVNHASCITCHERGMKFPTQNGLVALLKAGVTLQVLDYRRKEQIEEFNLTDVGKQLDRDCEDYSDFVKACNGLAPEENALNYKQILDLYRAELTLGDAARELRCTPEELRLALGYAGLNKLDLGSRLSGLAHGLTVPRDQWEDDYLKVEAILNIWRKQPADLAELKKPSRDTLEKAAQVDQPKQAPSNPPQPIKDIRPPQLAKPSEADKGKLKTTLVVNVPADARLFISTPDTVETEMAGIGRSKRVYPGLRDPDWKITCTFRAVVEREGKTIEGTATAVCEAGKTTEVTIDLPPVATTRKPEQRSES